MKWILRGLATLAANLGLEAAFAAKPEPWQMGFQTSASPVMDKLHDLHSLVLVIITGIAVFVLFLLIYVCWRFTAKKNPVPAKTTHHTALEIIWTIIPACILLFIAVPSFKLLYFMDKTYDAEMTVKVTGHQWYWSYEYPDQKVAFDSYMIADKDLKPGQLRLLDVDHELVVPVETNIRLLMTSADVIHSWAMPSMGIKLDTIPGKLRETWVRVKSEGTYYGQCSELCGVGHGFMPIKLKVVSKEKYKEWLGQAKVKFASIDQTAEPTMTLSQK